MGRRRRLPRGRERGGRLGPAPAASRRERRGTGEKGQGAVTCARRIALPAGSAPRRSCRAVRGPSSSRRRRPHLPRDPPAPRSAPCAASGRLCKMAALPGETTAGAAWGGLGGAPAPPAQPAPPRPAAGVPSSDAGRAPPRRSPARRARRRAHRARMGLVEALGAGAARLLFYPSLLYTVARAQLPGSRRPWFHRIDEVVLLGALPLRRRVRRVRQAQRGGPGREERSP